MISENHVDLSGYIYNISVKEYEKFTKIFFTLNIKDSYKEQGGGYVKKFNTIPCTIFGNKDSDGKHKKSFEYFDNNITEGQFLRVQGKITSWLDVLLNGKLVPLTEINKKEAEKIITRNNVIVLDYSILEKKEETLKRIKMKNEDQNTIKDETNHISSKDKGIDYKESEQGELYNHFNPNDNDGFPIYKSY